MEIKLKTKNNRSKVRQETKEKEECFKNQQQGIQGGGEAGNKNQLRQQKPFS